MDFNMADMFGKIQEMQSKVQETQAQLGEIVVEAETGGGMVKVKANGLRKVLSISVDKDVVDPDEEMLEDLIVAGVNKALELAEQEAQKKMQEAYKGMIPGGGLPGMDMSKFGL